ncbi:MAG: PD-(D/E)XK nuclease family protein [Ignavibacteriae bacterium]|nr:PD-(D/E)XK nuclease family protein [Ignavibacteriota bacterium]
MFLEKICYDILNKHRDIISDICVIFPSRRAGLYFKNILGNKIEYPIWSPSVYSIEDFVEEFSAYNFADNFKLLFELYSVYNDVIKNEKALLKSEIDFLDSDDDIESFDSFYPWGEMLLQDFDVIDKYLVDTNLLFKSIKDLKEIEECFPIELQESFKKFWGTLFDSKQTNAKKSFLKIWQVLGKVYLEFTIRLKKKGICYPGMAYRKLYEDSENILSNFKWKKIFFAGFNSLNPVEKNLMKVLTDKGIAAIYWDADDYYISNKNQEAGKKKKKNIKYFGNNKIKFEQYLISDTKKISSIGTSSSEGMAKVLGSELKEHMADSNFTIEKTAIVLPDANLLLPVLYSIPDEIKNINITMGFPFRDTPLYSLICLLIDLQNNCIYENGKTRFHHSNVEKILLHPYIKFHDTSVVYNIVNYIKNENQIYFNISDFKADVPKILEVIFNQTENFDDAVNYFRKIIDLISSRIDKDDSKDTDYKKFQLEFIYNFYSNYNRLNEVIKENEVEMNLDTYWRILKEVLHKISIPFTGEPLKGLQVMGLLETRALDFENVFILSANESVLPEGRTQNSFIPYSLRKVLKMPTYEEDDSITAYYFYRLIQKAKNIILIYDTDIGQNVKEKSRFILQIENELLPNNKNIIYENKIVIPDVYSVEKKNIEIFKTDSTMKRLMEIKHYSSTALKEYINCPLQFYFRRIAKIEEEKEIEESFDSMLIGNVLHKILEDIYLPFKGKIVSEGDINDIGIMVKENSDSILENAVRACKSDYVLKKYSGKNNLFKNIVLKLLLRVFENEKTQAPFKILDIEKIINYTFQISKNNKEIGINIAGRIDRIDEKDGVIRIIDYKTGSYVLKKFDEKNPIEYFEKLISNPDYKDNFQAFFYGYFYLRDNEGKKINVGIYPVKKMQNGIDCLKTGYIEKIEYELFENSLKKLFMEIYDSELPFKQVEDEKRCAYCHYSGLCYRDLNNSI